MKEVKNKKVIILLGVSILCTALLIGGVSYAYWIVTKGQTGFNKVNTSCLDIAFTEESTAISLEEQYPILDAEGRKLAPYTFTVTNTCDILASYDVALEVGNTSTLDASAIAAVLNTNEVKTLTSYETLTPTQEDTKASYKLGSGTLGNGDSETYNLRLWMDEDVTLSEEVMNKTFQGKVTVTARPATYKCSDYGINKLGDCAIASEYQTTTKEKAVEMIKAKQEPDFSKLAPEILWQENHASSITNNAFTYTSLKDNESITSYVSKEYTFDATTGKYKLKNPVLKELDSTIIESDEYYTCQTQVTSGTGAISRPTECYPLYKITSATKTVTNNRATYKVSGYKYDHVMLESDKSDKGLYVTQDELGGEAYYYRGSVSNNYVHFAGIYWRIVRINSDGTVKLIYAGTEKGATGIKAQVKTTAYNTNYNKPAYSGYMYGDVNSNDYNTAFATTNNSTIKDALEDWYKTNIEGKGYSKYIEDKVFCSDTSISANTPGQYSSTSTKDIHYGAMERLYNNKEPSLSCPQDRDKYTVSSTLGNGKNAYPVGLITADEIAMAGGVYGMYNALFYLYTGATYWTMSPAHWSAFWSNAYAWHLCSDGHFNDGGGVRSGLGLRPVINLKADVLINSGSGTVNDPYEIAIS